MEIILDEGYMYGLGAFETMSVVGDHCIFLKEHIARLNRSLAVLGIDREIKETAVLEYIAVNPMENAVLKIMVSGANETFAVRKNTYTDDLYEKGFTIGISSVMRNETSPFTYIKSFNYGDNIIEKRKAVNQGLDEPLFLNSKGQICEGATTNIFFVGGNVIYTPPVSCGLLDGIIRKYIIDRFDVVEKIIYPEEIKNFDEVFVTNSLMGVMPVRQIGDIEFHKSELSRKIMNKYQSDKFYYTSD